MARREWYVYLPLHSLVLSGYETIAEASAEANRVERELRQKTEVLPREDPAIKGYALTHPAWAKREGFEFVQAQTAPSRACPLCPKTVAGGPEEYLGHIRTEHPGEWRRLETDPSYTLRRAVPVAVAGIMKCRYCGAPYAYRENLELHEKGCPRRG